MPARVLIVDDDDDIRILLRVWIEEAPEDVEVAGEAGGAEDALAQIDDLDPDVVLLDARMPSIDGFEAAKLIRARRPGQALVLFTGLVEPDLRERAAAAGFADCVGKNEYKRLPAALAAAAARPA